MVVSLIPHCTVYSIRLIRSNIDIFYELALLQSVYYKITSFLVVKANCAHRILQGFTPCKLAMSFLQLIIWYYESKDAIIKIKDIHCSWVYALLAKHFSVETSYESKWCMASVWHWDCLF